MPSEALKELREWQRAQASEQDKAFRTASRAMGRLAQLSRASAGIDRPRPERRAAPRRIAHTSAGVGRGRAQVKLRSWSLTSAVPSLPRR